MLLYPYYICFHLKKKKINKLKSNGFKNQTKNDINFLMKNLFDQKSINK